MAMNSALMSTLDADRRRALANVRAAAARIWSRPLHRYYTDHTVTHSERVIALLDGLTAGMMGTDERLSSSEVFVLLAAAYLHDVGMQDERFAGGDLGEIRARHNERTAEMIGIGAVLCAEDFKRIAQQPVIVLIGSAAQFTIMPLGAFLVTRLLGLPDELAVGLILAGSAPGAMASNVMSYIAKADTAYSVSLTTVSTLLCPLLTPGPTAHGGRIITCCTPSRIALRHHARRLHQTGCDCQEAVSRVSTL